MTTHPEFSPYHHHHHHHQHQQVAMGDDLYAHAQGAPRNRGSSIVSNGSGGNNKDSRWLTLNVCCDHLRGACPKKEDECMSAHLIKGCSAQQEQTNEGRVMCCYDFIKGKCHRKEPPCKFFHPPPHLREVLLFNGRQNLILKNLKLQQALGTVPFIQPNAVMPVIYTTGPPQMNTAAPSKMPPGDASQLQPFHPMAPNPLASYWIINQGGMTYFYPIMMAPESWVSVPANGMANCHGVPSPSVHGSLKQIDQSIPFTTFGEELFASPWLQNSFHATSSPYYSCYGVTADHGCMKRPCEFNYISKVNTLS